MTALLYTVEENKDSRFGLKVSVESGELYRYYASISDSREVLEDFIKKCKDGKVSHEHIDDLVCDLICIINLNI